MFLSCLSCYSKVFTVLVLCNTVFLNLCCVGDVYYNIFFWHPHRLKTVSHFCLFQPLGSISLTNHTCTQQFCFQPINTAISCIWEGVSIHCALGCYRPQWTSDYLRLQSNHLTFHEYTWTQATLNDMTVKPDILLS